MRILAISDTHGRYDILEKIILGNLHADAFLHLGDGEYEIKRLLEAYPELQPKFYCVRGNSDVSYDNTMPESLILEASDGHKIFACHGHRHWVYYDTIAIAQAAKEQGCDIAVHGHTHSRRECYDDGVHILNPGSASQPRDGKPASYAWIDTSPQGVVFNILPVDPNQKPRISFF